MMPKIHIGKKIKEIWKKSRLKGTEFASLINRDRQVIYDIFKRESIDTELLQHISKVLNHDFFVYYSAEPQVLKDPVNKFGFATKEDFENLKKLVEALAKKIDERLPEKKPPASKKYGKK
ncbi:MAG TPA: helix-turn-helix transcriptional regulator [Bacteroidia bacterium]|nr:helix-turn-helix transcriptional regulator [Bacteroidia bacterium]